MSGFRFSLQVLLERHQRNVDGLQATLQNARNAAAETLAGIEDCVRKRDYASLLPDPRRTGKSQIIDSQRVLEVELFQESMQRDVDALHVKLEEQRKAAKSLQNELAASQQKLESLKQLRNRQLAQWQDDQQRHEQSQLDELAGMVVTKRHG